MLEHQLNNMGEIHHTDDIMLNYSTCGMFQKCDMSAAGSVARVQPDPMTAIFVLFSLSCLNRVLWDWYLKHCRGRVEHSCNLKFHCPLLNNLNLNTVMDNMSLRCQLLGDWPLAERAL